MKPSDTFPEHINTKLNISTTNDEQHVNKQRHEKAERHYGLAQCGSQHTLAMYLDLIKHPLAISKEENAVVRVGRLGHKHYWQLNSNRPGLANLAQHMKVPLD